MYYFAYGSNLSRQQMTERCPGSRVVGIAWLESYRLRFDGHSANWNNTAVANITPSALHLVWGVLYEVTAAHLAQLDEFEHAPVNYWRWSVRLRSPRLGWVEAVTYLRPPLVAGHPSSRYIARVLEGALDQGLPPAYVAEVAVAAET